LRTILGVAVPAGVVTTEELAGELQDPRWRIVSWESLVSQPERAILTPNDTISGHLAYLVHTSGTTGQPKIIQIEQHSAANLISSMVPVYKLGPGERRFQLSQPGPDFFIAEILLTFCSGATLVLPAKREVFAPGDFLAQLERDRITLAGIPSSYWRELVRYFARKGEAILPGRLRLLIVGMEAVDSSALEDWNRLVPERLELLNVYGPSETTMITTVYALRQGVPPGETLVPIGRPIANTAMYVLDQHGQLLPPGAVGEMAIAGAGVMRGYMGSPGGQPQPNPHDTRPSFARLYRTGDFGHLRTDGNFVFAGRRDGQVKIRGHRIELATVEKHLAQAADGSGVAALAVRRGERQMLVGVVEADGAPDPDTIRQRLRVSAREALIPAAILFISPFPRLPNGKIDRRELQRHAERELASPIRRPSPTGGSLQERMIAVWNEVFETEACSPDSHFFALGGDSLLAVRLSLRAEERLGRPLPLGHLYAHPTLRELVEKLDGRSETPRSLLVPLARGTGQAPLFAFHGWGGRIFVWPNLARHLAGERDCWGIQGHEHIGQAIPRTMREICETYAAAIHQQDHGGPVVLIGHSLGAIIAYETARHFAARGGRVQRVVLLDPPPPNSRAGLLRRSVLSPVGRQLPVLKQLLRKARYGSLPKTSSPIRETHAQLEVDYYKPLLTAHFPKRSELPILYIHCEAGRTRPPFAWRRLFDGPCDTAYIATSHYNMVAEPALSEIARIIRALT
jgi:amino acid adenylation domain-containing protein